MRRKHRHRAGFMQNGARTAMGITTTGICSGAGAVALSSMGGASAGHALTGLGNMSGMFPAVGSIGGTGMVLGSISDLGKIIKRKNK